MTARQTAISVARETAAEQPEPEARCCPDCERWWYLAPSERRWFLERGMPAPVRCRGCRRERRRVQPFAPVAAERRQDVVFRCADCGQMTTWTAERQIVCARRGWPRPRRCPNCARAERARHRRVALSESTHE